MWPGRYPGRGVLGDLGGGLWVVGVFCDIFIALGGVVWGWDGGRAGGLEGWAATYGGDGLVVGLDGRGRLDEWR